MKYTRNFENNLSFNIYYIKKMLYDELDRVNYNMQDKKVLSLSVVADKLMNASMINKKMKLGIK